ncbi:hypothetical protein RFI_38510 [Reticulomyxa filosa]|uniref:Uncharacterized protein n=1 Tax=Reticulomyxa filosa TaxID=46433 RepID=X6LE28_RETFI|nr:hypothetical protein RFI_38510 [Reticulomyxa filosa]|eukprot:ETN98979.1 hypothetical protein RFI_38510 [Reticulomyxa filosa]
MRCNTLYYLRQSHRLEKNDVQVANLYFFCVGFVSNVSFELEINGDFALDFFFKKKKQQQPVDFTFGYGMILHTRVATLRVLGHRLSSQSALLNGRYWTNEINDNDDDDSAVNVIFYSFVNYFNTLDWCYMCQYLGADASIIGSTIQKLLHYLQCVGGAGAPAVRICEQYFMSAIEPPPLSKTSLLFLQIVRLPKTASLEFEKWNGLLLTRPSLKGGDEIFNYNSFHQVFRYFARLNGIGGNIVIEIKVRTRTRTNELLLFGVQMEMDVYYMKFGMKIDKLLLFTLPLGCSKFTAIKATDSNGVH